MFTILGRGQVRLHRGAWERSFLCAYLIFADVLLHLKIQFDKFDFFLKKFEEFFFLQKFFFENIFFFEIFFWKKNFFEIFFFRNFFWICSWCFKSLIWFRFWMSIQLFHLFHNAHTISQDCDLFRISSFIWMSHILFSFTCVAFLCLAGVPHFLCGTNILSLPDGGVNRVMGNPKELSSSQMGRSLEGHESLGFPRV